MNTANQIKSNQIIPFLETAHSIGSAAVITGQAGIGKTAIINQYAKQQGKNLYTIFLPHYSKDDIAGIYNIQNGEMTTSRSSLLPPEDDPNAILFIDEITRASDPDLQNSGLQLMHELRVGEHLLHPDTQLIGAGNTPKHSDLAEPFDPAFLNRVMQAECVFDPKVTIAHALDQAWHPYVTAFMKTFPQRVDTFDKDEFDGFTPFGSPRSWDKVNELMQTEPPRTGFLTSCIASCVGTDNALAFVSFMKLVTEVPNIAAVAADPTGTPIPTRLDLRTMMLTTLGAQVTEETAPALMKFGARLSHEECTVMIKGATRRNPDLARVAEVQVWLGEHFSKDADEGMDVFLSAVAAVGA